MQFDITCDVARRQAPFAAGNHAQAPSQPHTRTLMWCVHICLATIPLRRVNGPRSGNGALSHNLNSVKGVYQLSSASIAFPTDDHHQIHRRFSLHSRTSKQSIHLLMLQKNLSTNNLTTSKLITIIFIIPPGWPAPRASAAARCRPLPVRPRRAVTGAAGFRFGRFVMPSRTSGSYCQSLKGRICFLLAHAHECRKAWPKYSPAPTRARPARAPKTRPQA